jgi:CheY-like chemotaxis protein
MASRKREIGKARLGRVLIVEDDPVLALELEAALLGGGAEAVVICPTMAATMAELEAERPDAIILDVHLADRNDGWALAELVAMLGNKPPRIVFSTGSPEEIPPEIAETAAVFTKPYDPADLVAVLAGGAKRGLLAKLHRANS